MKQGDFVNYKFFPFLRIILPVSLFLLTTITINLPSAYGIENWKEYPQNPFVIKLDKSQNDLSRRGGIIVADLNGDGFLDYLVSTKTGNYGKGKATIGAYLHNGDLLWVKENIDLNINGMAETHGLPGWHGPGVSVSDIDGDRQIEVIHLGTQNEIIIRNGLDGDIKKTIKVRPPQGNSVKKIKSFLRYLLRGKAERAIKSLKIPPAKWAHFQMVNLKEANDDEIILQSDPYPFKQLKAVSLNTGETLWEFNDYIGQKHGGFRAADIDNDGFDEVVGGMLLDEDGTVINPWEYRQIRGHLDSLTIADVMPNEPGLEWVVTEESHRQDDRTAVLGKEKIFFYHSFEGQEPQNVAVGDFDLERPGLEIWCRSRYNTDQRPWVIDAAGNTIVTYRINDQKPDSWSDEGVEVITAINWDGSGRQLLAAKERHTKGKIAILEPLSGEFKKWWDENADRIYVADVVGDSREEIIVVNSKENEIRIYWNNEENLTADPAPQPWKRNEYRRQKMNYNYYSP